MNVDVLLRGSILVLLLAVACPLSMAQDTGILGEDMLRGNESLPVSSSNLPDLSYIWSVSGVEPGQVTVALNQENETIYGQAKYEPDGTGAWNAVVIGWVRGYNVELVLTYIEGTVETTSRLNGTYDPVNQSITGDLMKIRNSEVTDQGAFEAVWINPDTTSYTPAIVASESVPSAADLQAAEQQAAELQAPDSSAQTAKAPSVSVIPLGSAAASDSYFHDVREDAERVLTGVGDISQIPIGMGGSGLS